MLDPAHPLYLPKGSIRAILALVVVVFGGAFLIAAGATEAIIGIVGVVIGYYFGRRDAETPVA
jgi:hypothetical protein